MKMSWAVRCPPCRNQCSQSSPKQGRDRKLGAELTGQELEEAGGHSRITRDGRTGRDRKAQVPETTRELVSATLLLSFQGRGQAGIRRGEGTETQRERSRDPRGQITGTD